MRHETSKRDQGRNIRKVQYAETKGEDRFSEERRTLEFRKGLLLTVFEYIQLICRTHSTVDEFKKGWRKENDNNKRDGYYM